MKGISKIKLYKDKIQIMLNSFILDNNIYSSLFHYREC